VRTWCSGFASVFIAMIGSSATAEEALDRLMTPEIARMTGEINATVKRCGFKLRASDKRIFTLVPRLYHDHKRGDLLNEAAAASLAFQKRYENDPVGACDEARSRHGSAFE
jgi:hypothetical protein